MSYRIKTVYLKPRAPSEDLVRTVRTVFTVRMKESGIRGYRQSATLRLIDLTVRMCRLI